MMMLKKRGELENEESNPLAYPDANVHSHAPNMIDYTPHLTSISKLLTAIYSFRRLNLILSKLLKKMS